MLQGGECVGDGGVWGVLGLLLDGLLTLSCLLLQQGAVREALYYTREGGHLAKTLSLGAW